MSEKEGEREEGGESGTMVKVGEEVESSSDSSRGLRWAMSPRPWRGPASLVIVAAAS